MSCNCQVSVNHILQQNILGAFQLVSCGSKYPLHFTDKLSTQRNPSHWPDKKNITKFEILYMVGILASDRKYMNKQYGIFPCKIFPYKI